MESMPVIKKEHFGEVDVCIFPRINEFMNLYIDKIPQELDVFQKFMDHFCGEYTFFKDLCAINQHAKSSYVNYSFVNYYTYEYLADIYNKEIELLIGSKDIEFVKDRIKIITSKDFFLKNYFTSLYKVDEFHDIKLEMATDSSVETFSFEEFRNNKDMIQEVLDIYRKNFFESPNLSNSLVDRFKQRIETQKGNIFVFKLKNKIASFYVLREVDDQTVSFEAFNVDDVYRNSKIGEMMMKQFLDQVSKDRDVVAECNAHARIGAKYIERGFVATEYFDAEEVRALKINRASDERKKLFKTKQMSKEELIQFYIKQEMGNSNEDFVVREFESLEKTKFDELSEGMVLTRYFNFGTDEKNKWYLVFEKK